MTTSTPSPWPTIAPALLLCACAGPDIEERSQDTLRVTTASRIATPTRTTTSRKTRVRARPCRQDVLAIDVPTHIEPVWRDLSFLSELSARIESEIAGTQQAWFCATASCLGEPVRVEVYSVLPERSVPRARADGHLRFLRVRFFGEASGRAMKLTDAGQCEAVSFTRGLVSSFLSVPTDTFYVSRECDARAMTYEGDPSAEMVQWHLPRMGLSASREVPTAPALGTSFAHLALVDSGIESGVAAAIGASPTRDFAGTAGLHEHGSGMGLLARQIAPQVGLHDVRVLGASGSGTGGALAQGLDFALFDGAAGEALVVNLSLGWPAELGAVSGLRGGTCDTYEDPYGEPVRYLLDVARRLDEAGDRRIFVSAAAGNRPLPVPADMFPAPSNGLTAYLCGTTGAAPSAFYPGAWNYAPTCHPIEPSVTRGAFAVSAIDARYREATKSLPGSETALVAIGEHVTVDGVVRTSPSTCTSGEAYPPPVRLPASFSGSSVSSVFVAAAAAHAQQLRAAARAETFDAKTLGNLLYLTGKSLCRLDASGVPVRRLEVARLERAATHDRCADLRACAASAPGIDPNLLSTCGAALVACGLEPGDATGQPIFSCPVPSGSPLEVPAAPTLGCGASAWSGASVLPQSSCAGSCPDEAGTDAHLVGSLGPQPGQQGCPFCVSAMNQKMSVMKLSLGLNPDFDPATQFSQPWLRITGKSNGTPTKVYVDLGAMTSAQDWHPGAWLDISLELSPQNMDPATVAVALIMNIQTPQATYATTDVSPVVPKFTE